MKAIDLNDRPLFRALLGHIYGRTGRKDKALRILQDLSGISKQQFVSPVNFALIHAGLGDADKTFQWLEKAYDARTTRVHELSSPYYDNLRADPRYAELMKRIGLPL